MPEHKVSELWVMYPRQLVGSGDAIIVETSRQACMACHVSVFERVVSAKGLRIKHQDCATGSTCDTCHAVIAHGKATGRDAYSSMEDCVACHSRSGAPIDCETCHEDEPRAERPRQGSWQVTHGSNWEKTHGMGDLESCAPCHAGTYCAKCHVVAIPHPSNFGTTHGSVAVKDSEPCEVCHEPEVFCEPCHGMEMPHPTGFLQKHSAVAKSVDDERCSRCHAMTDCDKCHDNHVHPGGTQPPPPPIGANR